MRNILAEIVDHFAITDSKPGNDWAFDDDQTSIGLDHRSVDGSKMWLDLNRDGTITIFWKKAGSGRGVSVTYAEKGALWNNRQIELCYCIVLSVGTICATVAFVAWLVMR